MDNGDPLVSVIVPIFNREDYVPQIFELLGEQTFQNFETIIVDDGSSDNTVQRVQQLSGNSVTCLRHEENRGAAEARNTGIKQARGRYLAFFDSDDRWKPTKLERQIECIRRDPQIGLVYTGLEVQIGEERNRLAILPDHQGWIFEDQLHRDWIGGTPTWLVRRRCFEELGLFDPQATPREDYEFNLRLSREYRVDYVRESMVVVEETAENRISRDLKQYEQGHLYILNEVIRPTVKSMNFIRANKILSVQFFTLGRYLQRHGNISRAQKFLWRAITHNIFSFKAWGAFLLAVLGWDFPPLYYRAMDRYRAEKLHG